MATLTSSSGQAPPPAPAPLNGHGIFAIIVFAIVALICIYPLSFRVPHPSRWLHKSDKAADAARPAGADDVRSVASSAPTKRTLSVRIDHVTAPLVGVLLLLATTTIGGEQVKYGIVGEGHIEPYDVLALFISLAYIAISLDATGLLRYAAFLVCIRAGGGAGPNAGAKAKGNGLRLYLLLYSFFWALGVAVGNDPVILSGTAFLVYFTRVAGISPPSAWIWAQFVAANISSAVLVSSNPTNLVIAKGFGVGFGEYTAYMVLPSAASALAAVFVLLLFFRNRPAPKKQAFKKRLAKSSNAAASGVEAEAVRAKLSRRPTTQAATPEGEPSADAAALKADGASNGEHAIAMGDSAAEPEAEGENADDSSDAEDDEAQPLIFIPHTIVPPDVEPRSALVDPWGALFGTVVMLTTLVVLVATSVVGGVKVFMVALPGAVLCLARDAAHDWYKWRQGRFEREREAGRQKQLHRSDSQGPQAESGDGAAGDAVPTLEATTDAIELQTLPPAHLAPTESAGAKTPGAVSATDSTAPLAPSLSRNGSVQTGTKAAGKPFVWQRIAAVPHRIATVFPTVAVVFSRLPFPLLPFAFSMFILVQGLAHVGFIDIMARGLGRVCAAGGLAGTAFFISTLGVILCNIGGTNIGATILLTKALQSDQFTGMLAARAGTDVALVTKGALYSVAFGSNVGALGGTFAASLAGLLWKQGLRQGGVVVGARQFALWCAVTIVPATAAGVGVLLAEVRYFHIGS